jgi:hypothetical protein
LILSCTIITLNHTCRWGLKKVSLHERSRARRRLEEAKASAGVIDEAELAKQLMEKLVMDDMGPVRYYLTPWARKATQMKIEKRKEIEAELEAKEAKGELDEEDGDGEEQNQADIQLQLK